MKATRVPRAAAAINQTEVRTSSMREGRVIVEQRPVPFLAQVNDNRLLLRGYIILRLFGAGIEDGEGAVGVCGEF
jgi:hypothetical protein